MFNYRPWELEPNIIDDYMFSHHYKMLRNPQGAWCGYVEISDRNHVLFGNSESFIDSNFNIDVHGGITYCGFNEKQEFWIGFDCAHGWDYTPSIHCFGQEEDYKSIDYVQKEICSLILQIRSLSLKDRQWKYK